MIFILIILNILAFILGFFISKNKYEDTDFEERWYDCK